MEEGQQTVLADRCVLSGENVTDASSLTCANEMLTHVKLFLIHDFVTLSDDGNIPPFTGTTEIHQLLAKHTGRVSLFFCRFSCYCSATRMKSASSATPNYCFQQTTGEDSAAQDKLSSTAPSSGGGS